MAEQMDCLRGQLGIKGMDRVPNAPIRQLYVMTKSGNEKID